MGNYTVKEKGAGNSWINDVWSNFINAFFLNQHSLRSTHFPSVLQRLDSRGIEDLIMILEKVIKCKYHHRSDNASQQSVFSCWGTENISLVPNQENMEGDQPVQSHSHPQQPLQPQTSVKVYCSGETGLPSSVFQAVHERSLVLLELLIQCGFMWKNPVWVYVEENNAVSIRKGWR